MLIMECSTRDLVMAEMTVPGAIPVLTNLVMARIFLLSSPALFALIHCGRAIYRIPFPQIIHFLKVMIQKTKLLTKFLPRDFATHLHLCLIKRQGNYSL